MRLGAHAMTHENGRAPWAQAARLRPATHDYSIPGPVGPPGPTWFRNSISCAEAHAVTHENGGAPWAQAARLRPVPYDHSIPGPVGPPGPTYFRSSLSCAGGAPDDA